MKKSVGGKRRVGQIHWESRKWYSTGTDHPKETVTKGPGTVLDPAG